MSSTNTQVDSRVRAYSDQGVRSAFAFVMSAKAPSESTPEESRDVDRTNGLLSFLAAINENLTGIRQTLERQYPDANDAAEQADRQTKLRDFINDALNRLPVPGNDVAAGFDADGSLVADIPGRSAG